jgi:hypothetical protein
MRSHILFKEREKDGARSFVPGRVARWKLRLFKPPQKTRTRTPVLMPQEDVLPKVNWGQI